jgi:hypothetical protein
MIRECGVARLSWGCPTKLRFGRCNQFQGRYSKHTLSVGSVDSTVSHHDRDGHGGSQDTQPGVERTDRLHVPHRKRLAHAYVTAGSGARELCLYYGTKEVVFDDERFFAFGEQLVRQTSFIAEAATSWGPGYDWAELQPMLEALVGDGIIKRGEVIDDARGGGLVPGTLPPSVCPVARTWSAADCESITHDLGGRPVEIGNLEAILSVYRVAHPALDGDDRQVGEANVFPPGLRLDRDTEWRVCQYSGSRYRDDAPMNVTALKAMIKHWKPMMVTLLAVRAELRARLARIRGGWTVGDMHLLSGVVLSLPAYQLMLRGGSSPQPAVHPVLSSLFRITDGIRMVTHLMLFLSDERTRRPSEPTTATELYEFAERNGLFLSGHGVCAGPRPLIDEFLAIAFEGTPVPGADGLELAPEVQDLLSQLPAAVDYALLGLESWAVSRSIWLAMSRAYRTIHDALEAAGGDTGNAGGAEDAGGVGIVGRLRDRVRGDWKKLNQGRIADRYEHDVHVDVYTDTYEQAWRGLRSPTGAPTLAERIAPRPEGPPHVAAARRLRDLLGARLPAALADQIVAALALYLREEQAILGATEEIQAEINAMLARTAPSRRLTARDLRVNFAMYGGSIAEFPYLFDTLEDALGIRTVCTADAIDIAEREASRPEPEPSRHSSPPAGM